MWQEYSNNFDKQLHGPLHPYANQIIEGAWHHNPSVATLTLWINSFWRCTLLVPDNI